MKSKVIIPIVMVILAAAGVFGYRKFTGSPAAVVTPTPSLVPVAAEQLPVEQQPQVSLTFTKDGHFVTINLSNLNAAGLEYNLIYDALVKNNQIQTGVTGSAEITGLTEYSNKQLLGSESSGKFTYHEQIANAVLELTLRNSAGYSIYSAVYPFSIVAGQTVAVTSAQ